MTMVFGKLMFRRAQSSKGGSLLIRDDTIIGRSIMKRIRECGTKKGIVITTECFLSAK